MIISLIQDTIHWANTSQNLQKTENHLRLLAGKTNLAVLPEMFTTGFCTDRPALAQDMQGETMATLKRIAQTYNMAITGSFIAKENGKNYNRGFFVFPDGRIETSDKRHLFSIGGEHQHFEPGNNKLIVNYCGFNIRLLICYDLRFPVWARNVNNEYDLLIYVANFPQKRIRTWDILLQARAIENQAYVCGVNCTGTDGQGIEYNGHSVLLDYMGAPLLTLGEAQTSVQTYDIGTEPLSRFRQKSAFWKDADQFTII